MASGRGIVRRCMKCAIDASHLGSRLKKCTRCAERGVEFPYCSKECQKAHWQIHKLICCNKSAVVVTDPDAKRLRAHINRWFVVYKPVLEWALYQLSLTRARDVDSKNLFVEIELDYAPGAPPSNVPRLRLTRLTCPLVTEVQIHLPDPFATEDAQIVRCNLKGYEVFHKCAANALATLRNEPPCPRWNFIVGEMTAFGFQDQIQLMESLRLAIARHFTFEAFLGANSPLREAPFPPLSQRMPPNLNISPWIWIKDAGFVAWFEQETGMTVATRLAELQAQARRDAYTEQLIQWATNPLSPTLEDFWSLMSERAERLGRV